MLRKLFACNQESRNEPIHRREGVRMIQRERSVLSVPGSNWHMIEKAAMLVVDLAFIDLEDAVAPNAKVESPQQVIKAFHTLDWRGKPRAYRINALDTPFLLSGSHRGCRTEW
jgi:hypothetical protein